MAIRNALPFEFPYRWPDLRRFFGKVPDEAADFLDQRDRDLEDFLAGLGGSAGGIPTLFVAASNATDRSREIADYVCTGSADQTQINAAMSALDATSPFTGRVLLSEGDFYLTSNVQLGWRTTLQGFGYATALRISGAITGVATDEESLLRDVYVYGGNSSGSVGIYAAGVRSVVENCSVERCQTGINIQSGSGPTHVLNCRVGPTTASSPYGVDISATANDALVHGCVLAHPMRMSSNYSLISHNRLASGATITVTAGSGNCFTGNFLPGGLADFSDSGSATQRGTNFSTAGTW